MRMRSSQSALLLGLATSGGMVGLGSDFEIQDVEKWLSYSIGELRIRPQFDTSFVFSDNIFYSPNVQSLDVVSFSRLVYAQNGTYTQANFPGAPIYQGFLQYRAITLDAIPRVARLGAVFTSDIYPGPQLPQVAGQDVQLLGATTNTLRFTPRTSDVISTVSPGLKIQYGSEEFNYIGLEYNLDSVRYLDQGIIPAPMHRLRNQFRFEKSRLRTEGVATFGYLSSFLGGGANQRGRLVDRWNGNIDGKVTYDSSAKTDVYVNAAYNFTEYSSSVSLYSVNTWRSGLGATYKPTERIFIFTEGHYGQTALSPSSTNLLATPYSQTYGGYVGVRGKFTERIEGTIRGGYELREFPSVAVDGSFSIPAAEASITYLIRDTTQLSLGYNRRTDVAPQVARQLLTYDSVRFGVRQVIGTSAKWVASADVSFNWSDFGSTVSIANVYDYWPGSTVRVPVQRAVDFKRNDLATTYSAGVMYLPRTWLKATLSYEYENYEVKFADSGLNDILIPSYDSHRVMLGLQVGF